MKKTIHFTALTVVLAILSVLLSSCPGNDKDEDNDNNNNNNGQAPTENKLTAKIDNADWAADVSTINALYVSVSGLYASIVINGEHANGSFFTLSLNLWNGMTGTFSTSLSATSNFVGLTYDDPEGQSYNSPVNGNAAATGTLKIDYWENNKVSGTFSFTGGQQGNSQTISVTNGVFSCINVQ